MHLTQGLERAVQQHPDRIATICGSRLQTFAELKDRVARIAAALRTQGVARGDRVAILALNSDHFLEAYLAVAWAGAVVVPVNFRWTAAEIAFSLNDSECGAILVDQAHLEVAEDLKSLSPGLGTFLLMGVEMAVEGFTCLETLIPAVQPLQEPSYTGSELLGIFYTGGTTGRSKGVMLTHANLCSSGLSMLSEGVFEEGCIALHVAPMFHLADMLMTACVIIRGGAHVFLPAFSPDAVLRLVAEHKVTDTLVVPAMLQALVDCPTRPEHETASLSNILYGASPAPESLMRRAMEAFPNARLTQGYGMTESAALICVLPWRQHAGSPGQPSRLRAAGRSTYDVLVRIVDADGHEAPRGEVGEIVAKGPNVMQGYLNLPDETAKALNGGWLHTGDMAWMDDEGYVFIVDRAKDMIISGGENIYSSEVENAIASHPVVAANAIIGIPQAQMGESVHAVVVLRPGCDLTLDDLQAHCRKLIAGYKLPRSLELRDSLPISGAGKVLKTELRRPYWSGRDRSVS